jgi:hypothetical protein
MTQQNITGALQSLASQTGVPITTVEEEETVEDTGKRTYDTDLLEVRPGVMLDLKKAEELPKKRYLKIPGLFEGIEGPSPEAFSFTTSDNYEEMLSQQSDNLQSRITKLAQDNDGVIDPIVLETRGTKGTFEFKPTETSLIINSKQSVDDFQRLIGFADTEEEYTKALTNLLGEGNFKIFQDTNKTAFEPKYYVSVKRDDGSFTDFSPVTNSIGDYFKRLGTQLEFETAAGLINYAQAAAISTPFTAIPVVGVPLGAIIFAGALFAGGRGIEKTREFVKEELQITDEDKINSLSRFIEGAISTVFSKGTLPENLSGLFETFGGAPGLKQQLKIGLANIRDRYVAKQAKAPGDAGAIESVMEGVKKTDVGGELAVGGAPKLVPLILSQVVDNKIVGRVTSLAEQTSVIIPTRLREQMQSAVNYIKQYQKNIGDGNFKSFQNAVANFGQFISKAKSTERADIDYTAIGENIVALGELNTLLRNVQSQGMYKSIFDKLQNSSYNLDDLRELISKQYKTIIPTSDPGQATTKKTVGELLAANKGEQALRNLILDVMDLGRTSNKGTKPRELNVGQLKSAVETFNKNNPGFNIDPANVDSPAKILQAYASRFGDLAKNVFGDNAPVATQNAALRNQAMEMRNALLELIGKPKKPVDGIAKELKAANDFYKETFDTTEILEQARIGARKAEIPEPAQLSELIIGNPGGKKRGAPATITLEHINKMEKYVRENINKLGFDVNIPEKDLTALQGSFLEMLRFNIARGATTDPSKAGDATALDAFLNSFEPRSLRALGIDEATEAQLRADAKTVAQLTDANFLDIVGATAPENMPFRFVFEEILKGGSKEKFKNMSKLAVIAKNAAEAGDTTQAENIRKGLLEFIVSKDSGVLQTVTKQSAYARVGTDTVDVQSFKTIMDEINNNPVYKDILTEKDFATLNMLFDYTAIVQQTGTDAGAALSGAQLISNLYTLDPSKLINALARLAAQRRASQFITNAEFTQKVFDMSVGKGQSMTLMEKIETMMSGKGAFGAIAARIALEGVDETKDIRDQTDAALDVDRTQLDAAIESLKKQLNQ